MRKVTVALLCGLWAAGSAFAGDVGVIKNPGWWGPIWVEGPVYSLGGVTVLDGVTTTSVVPRGGEVQFEMAEGAGSVADTSAAAGGAQGGRLVAALPARADRATLLKLRQALAAEAERRGLR